MSVVKFVLLLKLSAILLAQEPEAYEEGFSDSSLVQTDSVVEANIPQLPKAGSDAESIKTEKPEQDKKGIVLVGNKEDQTEVITTYSGDENTLKSPKKAFFLSLLMPGLGEFYAEAKTYRIALPAAVELSTYSLYIAFTYKYNQKISVYKKFADENYSHKKFENWYRYVEEADSNKIRIRTTAHDNAYFSKDQAGKTGDYYEMIGKYDIFAQGWKDVSPNMDTTYYETVILPNYQQVPRDSLYWNSFALDSLSPYLRDAFNAVTGPNFMHYRDDGRPFYFGKSLNQLKYMELRNDANSIADLRRKILFTLIVNRIASSVNAAMAAISYNKSITGGSLSHNGSRIKIDAIQIGSTDIPANGIVASYTF